ncbi:MAG: NAD(P)-dependent oxidoreductase [Gammaproteobacteria bacterium]
MSAAIGFVGLGSMGAPMAANLAAAGHALHCHDAAGSAARMPPGAQSHEAPRTLAAAADTVFLSLPDGHACAAVMESLIAAPARRVRTVIDLSTVGVAAAQRLSADAAAAGIDYVDAPVSGGHAGAVAGTLTLMWAGSATAFAAHAPLLERIARRLFRVGDRPGQAQALKLLNNFLSATALAATSEAVCFGLSQGLSMQAIIEVLNVSTGCNTATSDKFPNRILTGSYDAGFHTALMAKDLALYDAGVRAAGSAHAIGALMAGIWADADAALPGSDFTRIFDFVRQAYEPRQSSTNSSRPSDSIEGAGASVSAGRRSSE